MDDFDPLERLGCPNPCDALAQPGPLASVEASPGVADPQILPWNGNVGIGGDAIEAAAAASRVVPRPKEMRTSYASGRKRKAPTLRDEDWEPVKKRIVELYHTSTLSGIVTDLEARYRFTAK